MKIYTLNPLNELILNIVCVFFIGFFALYNFNLQMEKTKTEIYNNGLKKCEEIGKKEFFSKIKDEPKYTKNVVDNSMVNLMGTISEEISKNCTKN